MIYFFILDPFQNSIKNFAVDLNQRIGKTLENIFQFLQIWFYDIDTIFISPYINERQRFEQKIELTDFLSNWNEFIHYNPSLLNNNIFIEIIPRKYNENGCIIPSSWRDSYLNFQHLLQDEEIAIQMQNELNQPNSIFGEIPNIIPLSPTISNTFLNHSSNENTIQTNLINQIPLHNTNSSINTFSQNTSSFLQTTLQNNQTTHFNNNQNGQRRELMIDITNLILPHLSNTNHISLPNSFQRIIQQLFQNTNLQEQITTSQELNQNSVEIEEEEEDENEEEGENIDISYLLDENLEDDGEEYSDDETEETTTLVFSDSISSSIHESIISNTDTTNTSPFTISPFTISQDLNMNDDFIQSPTNSVPSPTFNNYQENMEVNYNSEQNTVNETTQNNRQPIERIIQHQIIQFTLPLNLQTGSYLEFTVDTTPLNIPPNETNLTNVFQQFLRNDNGPIFNSLLPILNENINHIPESHHSTNRRLRKQNLFSKKTEKTPSQEYIEKLEKNLIQKQRNISQNPENIQTRRHQTEMTFLQRVFGINSIQEDIKVILTPHEFLELKTEKKTEEIQHEETCNICLDNVHNEQYFTTLPCNHIFHTDCIFYWLRDSSVNCPICRNRVAEGKPEI